MGLAAFLLAVGLSVHPAARPDDPAVRTCEMMVRHALRKPQSFARTGRPVLAANRVEIAYSSQDAHGRTVADRRTCIFRRAGDGRFHAEPFRRDYLATRMAKAQAKLAQPMSPNQTMLVRSEILDIGREMFVQDQRLRRAEREAAKAGIYPIQPALTALRD